MMATQIIYRPEFGNRGFDLGFWLVWVVIFVWGITLGLLQPRARARRNTPYHC